MHWYLPRVSNAHLLGNIDNDHAYQQNLFYSIQDVKLWHPESRTGSMYRFEWEDIAWNNHVIAFTLRMNMQHFSFDWTPAKNWWATCIDWDQLELSDDLRDHEQQSERLRGHLHTIQHCIVTNSIQGCLGYTCVSFIGRTRVSIRRFHKGVLYSEHCQHCHAVPFRKATCWLQSSKNFTDAIVGCQSRPAHVLQPRCNHALYMRTLYGW